MRVTVESASCSLAKDDARRNRSYQKPKRSIELIAGRISDQSVNPHSVGTLPLSYAGFLAARLSGVNFAQPGSCGKCDFQPRTQIGNRFFEFDSVHHIGIIRTRGGAAW
ncbi:MAG: hypothetical protein DMF46_03600 [Verrucomicrobia bacterium]|nr:MAG: hypothetical protein DMF46_03600 [Verrucomicrobiota bacterium]